MMIYTGDPLIRNEPEASFEVHRRSNRYLDLDEIWFQEGNNEFTLENPPILINT